MYRSLLVAVAAPLLSCHGQDWQAISGAGTCVTAEVPECAGANADQATCEAAGTCTFAAASGDDPATCTTTVVAECAAANADDSTCTQAGACAYSPPRWDADVERGTAEECGVGDVEALSTLPCGCSCADPPNAAGCIEDSGGMYDRTGYTCEQIAGTAENACVTAEVPECAGANADQATCEAAGACTFGAASGDDPAACTTTVVAECAAANADRDTCTGAGACIFLTGNPDYLHCNQLVRDITAEEAYAMWTDGIIDLIIDVRSPTEYESAGDPNAHNACGHGFSDEWDGCEIGHIPGSYLVPLNPWDPTQLLSCSTDSDKPVTEMTVATTCYNHASHPDSAWRSNTGAALLEQAGFKCVYNIVDGTKGWKERGFPVTLNEAWPAEPDACSGAPYYQAGASAAPAQSPATAAPMITISPTCPDLTGDSSVGVDDLLALLAGFGRQC
jgi:rhodanese-related sulfurtransferase|eukprot:COSAG06_NODE_3532_length_5223_cov_2.414520_3_plen_447_part_00